MIPLIDGVAAGRLLNLITKPLAQIRSDPDWIPELEEKIRQLEHGEESDDDEDEQADTKSR